MDQISAGIVYIYTCNIVGGGVDTTVTVSLPRFDRPPPPPWVEIQ